MTTVFDIGMYDGSDTAYYLAEGHRVVAVDANPVLVDAARRRFAEEIRAGRLTCVHAAISPDGKPVELSFSALDIGSSSTAGGRNGARHPEVGTLTVPGVTMDRLFRSYGVPEYLKVDIEGADHLCVRALTPDRRPSFLSFEVGDDVDELLAHAEDVGYRHFKLINQISFREISNHRCLHDRLTARLMRMLGYHEPRLVRRKGRFFVSGQSSGPVPWISDGRWHGARAIRSVIREAGESGILFNGWWDIHAAAAEADASARAAADRGAPSVEERKEDRRRAG